MDILTVTIDNEESALVACSDGSKLHEILQYYYYDYDDAHICTVSTSAENDTITEILADAALSTQEYAEKWLTAPSDKIVKLHLIGRAMTAMRRHQPYIGEHADCETCKWLERSPDSEAKWHYCHAFIDYVDITITRNNCKEYEKINE